MKFQRKKLLRIELTFQKKIPKKYSKYNSIQKESKKKKISLKIIHQPFQTKSKKKENK